MQLFCSRLPFCYLQNGSRRSWLSPHARSLLCWCCNFPGLGVASSVWHLAGSEEEGALDSRVLAELCFSPISQVLSSLVGRGIAAAVGRVPRGLLSPRGVRALGLPETPKLGERGSGERAELPLVLRLAAGLKLRVLLPCHCSLEPRDLLSPANLDG